MPCRVTAVASLVALLCLPICSTAQVTPGKIARDTFTFDGRKIGYSLFVPPGIPDGARVPLIVTLHGSGRDGRSLIDPWKDLAAREMVVLVGPDAQEPSRWNVPNDGPAGLCALVASLRDKLPVDPRRVYLFGHSGGAVFALYMAMLESEFFAAAAVHAGAWRSPAEFTSISAATRRIPVAIFVGDADRYFPVADVTKTTDALNAAGFPVETTILERHTHDYYGSSGPINRSAFAFLVNHVLEKDPLYTTHQFE